MKLKKKEIILLIIALSLMLIIKLVDEVKIHYEDKKNLVLLKEELKTNDKNLKIKVYILGEVEKEGSYELDYGSRIEDVTKIAVLKDTADLTRINLVEYLEDGEKILIPKIDEQLFDGKNKLSLEKFNLLKAKELLAIPGIGQVYADRIINYRNKNGSFKSFEELMNVKGIGEKKYENMKEYFIIE
ncbi:helix-hairpin-helix domain-containing protein [Helicovermis profundi]|uniref:Helix-hairpin-helix DNA-binding motif class 1 domain-containing protein n=1 Tax=Helicovermis profundi TaxID=3065157 RepID=A0AAU9E5F6_9FIRM|nr:hypothetical protein HLPR_22370 [Clostridia bacterium S502]